jgi:hypothetical protein
VSFPKPPVSWSFPAPPLSVRAIANVPPFTMSSPALPKTEKVSTPVCVMSDPFDESGVNVTWSAVVSPEMTSVSVPEPRPTVSRRHRRTRRPRPCC